MKHFRKYMISLAAASAVVVVAVPCHAAFSSHGATSLSASATTGGVATIAINSALIKNISDNGTVGTIGWTNPSAGWQVATQYIDLNTNITTTSGGVQIYTDNTNAAASPKYVAVISSVTPTPAGLVDPSGNNKLPTAWRASTFTLTGVNPVNPNANSGESFLWFFHEDKAQIAVPSSNATAFVNADPFVTLYAAPNTTLTDSLGHSTTEVSGGVHFAQDPTSFGGFVTNTHTYIYTEADFDGALAQTTYATNRLILEAFSL